MKSSIIKRFIDISYKHKLSHIGSGISCIKTIYDIYKNNIVFPPGCEKNIFILSNGHAALALYVVLEYMYGIDAEMLYLKHGTHPNRDIENKIYCSTGSLGLGITIAVGMAVANPNINVYCMISDGECAEGSVWESLRFIKENNIKNIHIYAIINGFSAYKEVNIDYLQTRLMSFLDTINIVNVSDYMFPFLNGISAHYHSMSDSDYKTAINLLEDKND